MKIPLSWVGLFSPVSETLSKYGAKPLAHEYSIRTAEIEGIDVFSFDSKIVVGKVVVTSAHPDSDHLNLVKVSLGGGDVRNIVCGAHNVVGAKYVALATEGATLGADFVIKRAKIRGQESNGMICSLDELGLQEERAEGIFRLEEAYGEDFLESKLGTPFGELPLEIPGLGGKAFSATLNDVVFEIDNKFITNRPDLFSVEGNAREFSALFNLPFQRYEAELPKVSNLEVKIESDRVLAYRLVSVKNVSAKESPLALRVLLGRADGNPKLDLVDMTNYVMTELGQPMHAFDADKIDGTVSVRLAKEGESLLALDGKEYSLTAEDLVIADESRVLAIAGVIGGAYSAVSADTKNILVESATFDPTSVRLTAVRTGCRTDASTRYEKSLDPLLAGRAVSRVLDLLKFFGNDFTVESAFDHLDASRVNDVSVSLELPFVASKLGIEIPESEVSRIMGKLGFQHEIAGTKLTVKVPSWRATKDVSIAEDIVEELGRVYGYDKIAEKAVSGAIDLSPRNLEIEFRNEVLSHFASLGFSEAYAYSFSNAEKDANIGFSDMSGAVAILNAVSTEYTHMRRSPAALLFQAASENAKHTSAFSFFEYGKVHFKNAENDFSEKRSLAGVSYGSSVLVGRDAVTSFLSRALPRTKFEISQGADASKFPFLHPGKCGTVSIGGKPVAAFGAVHPKTAEKYGFVEVPVSYFEIDPEAVFALVPEFGEPAFAEISKFPGVSRELNFVMDERDSAGAAASLIASASPLVSGVTVIDTYRDAVRVGEGKRSVTFSFRIEDSEKTITDTEAFDILSRAIAKMEEA